MPKGIVTNPFGRPKGSGNKVTAQLREMVIAFTNKNWETIEKDFAKLDSKDRITLYIKLLEYVMPKHMDVTTGGEKLNATPFTVTVIDA